MSPKADKILDEISKELAGCRCAISRHDGSLQAEAAPEGVPAACGAMMRAGGVFDSAFAYPSGGRGSDTIAAYVFRMEGVGVLAVVWARGKKFHAVSGAIPSALWDERKMREISGAEFVGLGDARPIVLHPENSHIEKKNRAMKHGKPLGGKGTDYIFEGTGTEGEFQIAVGPVHAGIIEPGHFRFFVSGEGINRMEARLSYMHRGIEEFARGKKMADAFPIIEQVSGDESVANSVAFAQAAEALYGMNVPARAESLRLLLLEEERIYSHLADLGGIATDVGFSAPASQFSALRERMMRLNEKCFGSRFIRGLVAVGGMRQDIPREKVAELRSGIEFFSNSLAEVEELAMSSSTFLDRAFSTGIVRPRTAIELGLVGPGARASGISCDLRRHFPYGAYRHARVNEALGKDGDALSRFTVKLNEVKESARLIGKEISYMQNGPVCAEIPHSPKEGEVAIGMCEAARGGCAMLLKAGKAGTIGSLGIRTASFRNWRALERAVLKNIVADFPLINKSFNLSYAGADL